MKVKIRTNFVKCLRYGLAGMVGSVVLGVCSGALASALTYQDSVDVQFTFEPSLTVGLSSSALTIPSLSPGNAAHSNTISVNVATNNIYGYTLSAKVGGTGQTSETAALTNTNTDTTFASLGSSDSLILANLGSNTWGYTTAGTINDASTTYSGLQYGTDTTLNVTKNYTGTAFSDYPGTNNTSFTIAAKASTDQLAGEYTNVITFTAVVNNVEPIGKTYMQNVDKATLASLMPNVGDEYIVYDNRDDKPYTVAHMADGNYWMTQNLDLCIGCTGVAALTSENTNLTVSGSGAYSSGYATSGGVITWTPASTAITSNYAISGTTVSPAFTTSSNTTPYSAEGGDTYVYTSGSTSNDTVFTSLSDCMTTGGHTEAECLHYHVGNYYTWSAAIASNDSSSLSERYTNADNSICPKGWSLPKGRASSDTAATREFGQLFYSAGITSSLTATSYATTDGFIKLRTNPLFFVRGGYVYGSSLYGRASGGYYWSSTVDGSNDAYGAGFYSSVINSAYNYDRYGGFPVRCLVR